MAPCYTKCDIVINRLLIMLNMALFVHITSRNDSTIGLNMLGMKPGSEEAIPSYFLDHMMPKVSEIILCYKLQVSLS